MELTMQILFAVMVVILGTNSVRSLAATGEFFGTPPIGSFIFFLGKICNISLWIILALHISVADLSLFPVPAPVRYAGFILFVAGSVFVTASFLTLGMNLRFGLSESLQLRKSGIYRVSRNPMYIGFYLIDGAALLYTGNPFLFPLLAVSIYAHHTIVIAEERFIRKRCPEEWIEYSSRVRRYV